MFITDKRKINESIALYINAKEANSDDR